MYVNGTFIGSWADHLHFKENFRGFKGRVLMGGLGFGWDAKYILESPEVTELVVVELVRELVEKFKSEDSRLKVVVGNFYEYDSSGFDCILDTCYGSSEQFGMDGDP